MMGVAYLISVLAIAVPLFRLLPRAGMSPWLSVMSLVPALGVVLLWIVAFKEWPGDRAEHG